MPSLRKPAIHSLTGFRFGAAMMVVLSHYPVPGASGTPLRIFLSGYAGVTFFFVLSGFVLTYNYLDTFQRGATLNATWDYLVARVARVYPLYVLFIMLGWLTSSGHPLWPYLLAIQAWHPDVTFAFALNGPSWSISVEVFLYLMFPLLVPTIVRLGVANSARRLLIATVLVSLVMLALTTYFIVSGRSALPATDPASAYRWLYRTPATRLGDFLLGMFGAVYVLRFARGEETARRCWSFIAIAALIGVACLMASKTFFLSAFSWDIGYALLGALLITALAINSRTMLGGFLSSSWMRLLGEASFALYLLHVPAGALLRLVAPHGPVQEMAVYVIFLAFVIAVSIGLHVVIEKPARRLVRKYMSVRRASVASTST